RLGFGLWALGSWLLALGFWLSSSAFDGMTESLKPRARFGSREPDFRAESLKPRARFGSREPDFRAENEDVNGCFQYPGNAFSSAQAVRRPAEKDAGDSGRSQLGRWKRVGQNGWSQASAFDEDRSRGRQVRRHRDAAGPGHGGRQRSCAQDRRSHAVHRRWNARRNGPSGNLVIW